MPIRLNEIRYALIAAVIWTILVALVSTLIVRADRRRVDLLSIQQSRTIFQTLIDFRSWNALHGGVYVPVDETTPPNPYLDIDRRDVVTDDGQQLTLVNPAYMTRQFAELSRRQAGIDVHITSLDPIRPANRADVWEARALESFDDGADEWWMYDVDTQGRPIFRYMAPLITEAPCLPCHAHQGYVVGDIRGGISITHPADLFVSAKADSVRNVSAIGFVVWLLGLTLIGFVARMFRRRRQALDRARKLTLVDSLTSVYNRRGFVQLAEATMKQIARRGSKALILFLDLDEFKAVNDAFGHDEGDVALRRVADVLRATFRGFDIIGRLGGDEFVVLLPDSSDEDSNAVRNRLWDAIRSENERANAPYELSISIGTAEFDPDEPWSLDDLLGAADDAMYAEKRQKSGEHGSATRRDTPQSPLSEH